MTHLQKLAMHHSAHPAAGLLLPPARFTVGHLPGAKQIWRVIPLAAAFTLLALSWLSWMALQSYRDVTEQGPALSQLEEIWAQILFFEGELTLSADAASASSDPYWDDQFRRPVAQLVKNVNDASVIATARVPGWGSAGTDAATHAVMAMEDRARFGAGVAQFSRSLKHAIDSEKAKLQGRMRWTLSAAGILGPILVLGWCFVLLAVHGWRVDAKRSHQLRNEQISELLGRYRRARHAD